MADELNMSTAPIELSLGEKTYRMGRLQISDFGVLEEYAKEKPLRQFKKTVAAMGDTLLPEERKVLFDEAIEARKKIKTGAIGGETIQVMASVEGLIFLVHHLICKEQPGTTVEEIERAMGFANMEEVKIKLDEALMGGMDPTERAKFQKIAEAKMAELTGDQSTGT